jgi:hypothetical protein
MLIMLQIQKSFLHFMKYSYILTVSFLNFAHIFAIVESSFQDYGLKKLTG